MELIESECNCNKCIEMCYRPCWGKPEELQKIIDEGFSDKLMLDYWIGQDGDLYLLCGALVGYEGKKAPYWPHGKCTFLKEDRCEIQIIKPFEGKMASCNNKITAEEWKSIRHGIALEWQSEKGKQILNDWKKTFFKGE